MIASRASMQAQIAACGASLFAWASKSAGTACSDHLTRDAASRPAIRPNSADLPNELPAMSRRMLKKEGRRCSP